MAKQISRLRQRMIDDMTIRNMSPNTQKICAYAVANFSAYHGCSPDRLGLENVRDYHLHLVSRRLKPTSRAHLFAEQDVGTRRNQSREEIGGPRLNGCLTRSANAAVPRSKR
jgi:Phage integrase, N-terminal SAM-like domain